jgi:galacturan 1,4-alpha-galacturonidase
MEAWASACAATGCVTLLIPSGDYLVGPLGFTGPCKGDITIQLEGNLLGSNDLSKYKASWIEVTRVDNIVITGNGTLDGQGKAVYTKDCKAMPNVRCTIYIAPTSLVYIYTHWANVEY